ncbi:MAG: hypothetical protein NTX17_05290 [Candidatus Eisenbacteria bacterium]|nr:hypothetical protein [Candidatus Eisenbacteria bacterium]
MIRRLAAILMCSVFLCGFVSQGKCEARKQGNALHVWWAPDSSWAVAGFGQLKPGFAERMMEKKPPELDGLKMYEMVVKEPGLYLGFRVGLKRVEKVVFTRSTKLVLTDKEGKRIESEGIFFYPDLMQTSLYDARKMVVVVTKCSVWCHPKDGSPCGWVKFGAGSIDVRNIAGFEVVGAVVDTLERVKK